MIIRKTGGKLEVIKGYERENAYSVLVGENGRKYVDRFSVADNILHVSENGNEKTGPAINFNFSIEYTCNHCCDCYRKKVCYASGGCYLFSENQASFSENLNFYRRSTLAEMVDTFQYVIDVTGCHLWRYFTCGDIPDSRFLTVMVKTAENNPSVRFWSYTKKYSIVNRWIKENGALPENLVIIFSHWRNDDGTYFPMENPYNLPVSEFIPLGMEEMKEKVTHICPCSDPNSTATCATCDYPCYKLRCGESMGLCEHSTGRTKDRDRELKAAKKALKATK